jgi:hypothetical protein
MPRLRNRVRRRVAAPIEEPAEDEETEPEDEADQEQPEDESGRPDPTARALREDAYRRRTGNRGELGDIAPSEISDLSQQVTTGTAASVNISDQFDPGFTRTEIVNRLGMVLSLSFSYDYSAGEWVPDPIDRTESQAIEQQLAEDRATDDLTGPADPGDGTTVDDNGDLRLEEPIEGNATVGNDSPNEFTATGRYGLVLDAEVSVASFSVNMTFGATPPTRMRVRDTSRNGGNTYFGVTGEDMVVNYPLEPGVQYVITLDNDGNSWSPVEFPNTTDPQDIPLGTCEGGQSPGGTGSVNVHTIKEIGNGEVVEEGDATTSFDNPCTATSVRSAQYDVCSRSSDVRVDLFEGDPDDPDSMLLRDDISQREDITAIPDSRTDIQYRIQIERGPDGNTPKVSRLGHQLIR